MLLIVTKISNCVLCVRGAVKKPLKQLLHGWGKVFIVDKRMNNQRCLEESRAERKKQISPGQGYLGKGQIVRIAKDNSEKSRL